MSFIADNIYVINFTQLFILLYNICILFPTTKNGAQQPPHPIFLTILILFLLCISPFQVILLLIQTIAFLAGFFHALQLRPYSLPAIRLHLFIFPGQIADCIFVFLYLLRKTYPVYQILHFLVRFVKVCICHDGWTDTDIPMSVHLFKLLSCFFFISPAITLSFSINFFILPAAA